jgi:hypothetical protein
MDVEEKNILINSLKLQDDMFQVFLEYFSGIENINRLDWYSSNMIEQRKNILEKIVECF